MKQNRVPVASALLTEEKIRGAVGGTLATIVSTAFNLFGVLVMGLSAPVSAFLFYYMFGGFVAYGIDVIIAKRDFTNHPGSPFGKPPAPVPYSDLKTRFKWLYRSLYSRHFFRFAVTILIETMTGVAMLQAAIMWMDDIGFYTDHEKLRNVTAAIVIAAANFVLFGAVLRFDWAYNESENQLLNIVVLMWLAIVLIIFAFGSQVHHMRTLSEEGKTPSEKTPSENTTLPSDALLPGGRPDDAFGHDLSS